MNYDRMKIERTVREAEGYLELGLVETALQRLQRHGKLVHASGRACYLMGEALREMRRYREALYPLRRSAALMPDDIHVWLALGWCYKRLGQIDMAIEALEQAMEVEPNEAILHYNLACYWSLAHHHSRAIHYLAQALEINSNYRDMVSDEPDFDALRDDPGFKMLTNVIV